MDEVELELDPGRRRERLRQLEPELGEAVVDPSHLGAESSLGRDGQFRARSATGVRARGSRDAARAPQLRLAAAAEPARGADHDAARRRAEARGGRRGARDRDDRRPALARPARLPRPRRRRAPSPSCGSARRRRCCVEVRSARVRPTAGATCGSSRRRSPTRAGGEGGVVQPGLARRAPAAGDAAAAERQARARRDFGVAAHEIAPAANGAAADGVHTTGLVPVHRATERPVGDAQAARVGLAGAARGRDALEPLPGRAARPARALPGEADALRAAHFPRDAGARPRRRATGSPSRSSACTRRRSRAPRARSARPAPGIAHRAARASSSPRWLALAARSSPPATSARRSTRSTPTSPPGGRCSGC